MNPLTHDHEVELYVLNALTSEETVEFETHLQTCSACTEALADLAPVVEALASGVEPVRPPARLKMNVLREIGQDKVAAEQNTDPQQDPASGQVASVSPLKSRRRWTVAAITSLAASFALGATLSLDRDEISPAPPTTVATPATVLDEIEAAQDSSTIVRRMKQGGTVTIAYSPSLGKSIVSSKNLPSLPEAKIYQLWFLDREGEMKPVGIIDQFEETMVMPDAPVTDAVALGVSVEPMGGSTTPTTDPLMVVNL